ncbi:hypothetical protein ACET3Z_031157 [Daucus carota]
MEVELEPRVKALGYKVKGMSRESPSQKGIHVLDNDLRTHWSTATNTKEWILLELDEPCLLSHIRIYNKSVLEWEISVGLRYKPEAFVKARPRCEAPRRDMMYPMNYTPCRYVRISCLRGNPIAIFFIQLIGVPVTGLEPEFQPVVSYLLPHIISHKQDAHDMHLQLLQDMTNRLTMFIPQLEAELNSFSDAPESNIRFLAMLAGPLYPILYIVNERETARLAGSSTESEASKSGQSSSALLVSSNFEPRRSRTASPTLLPTSSSIVFRPDALVLLLRKAYRDPNLGTVCRMAARILLKLVEPQSKQKASIASDTTASISDESLITNQSDPVSLVDYSSLFGEEFQILGDQWDSSYLTFLDNRAIEGVLHVLYACASQTLLCSKLANGTSDFWAALPLVQALLPALRPNVSSPDQVDDNFTQWKQPYVLYALSQIVAISSSASFHPLLRGCAGYLSSFSPSHARAASVLIDLCSGVLAPWLGQVAAKVDLTVELLEDLLGVIQDARHSLTRARAALKYIILALSGHMDDIMGRYKEVKHRILFLFEMLEPYLDPAISPLKSSIAFGNVAPVFLEKQENSCAIALNVIRTGVKKFSVLPSLESEWRRESVAPSVLLSILDPHMQLPSDINLCKFNVNENSEAQVSTGPPLSSVHYQIGVSTKHNSQVDTDLKADVSDATKTDVSEDVSLVFAPPELRSMALSTVCISPEKISDISCCLVDTKDKNAIERNVKNQFQNNIGVDDSYAIRCTDLNADYLQLVTYHDSELWATEFRRLALDLNSQNENRPESHLAAIDSLLLAAECYVNPFFLNSFKQSDISKISKTYDLSDLKRVLEESHSKLDTVSHLERRRDTVVLQILLEAAQLDSKYKLISLDGEHTSSGTEGNEEVINLSQQDTYYVDAITLVRQNQELLFNFLIKRLLADKNSMHEVLMQSLVFLLHSATKLYCTPENVIDIIIESAEFLNGLLMSFYCQFKEGNLKLDPVKVHEVQRRWLLLQRLVAASSGNEGLNNPMGFTNSLRFMNLIPPSAWIQKIPTISSSSFPLVRFLGWMAVSRNAKVYQKEKLFLASDLSQLMYLLSIFSDELAVLESSANQQNQEVSINELKHLPPDKDIKLPNQKAVDQSFRAIYPEISYFFPDMKKDFESFGQIILEAVGLQLRSLSSSVVPDLLCWFSDLCSWPFIQKRDDSRLSSTEISVQYKGFMGKNAKAVILYILESVVVEHIEAMVPEVPRVVQVLVSLCQASYCDVSFLEAVLLLLNPVIAYSLHKVSDEEKLLVDEPCLNFESLCFDELFHNIRPNSEKQDEMPKKSNYSRSLTIFILASVFPELTFKRKRELLQSLGFWAAFTDCEPTMAFHDYMCAFQRIMERLKSLLSETLRVWGVLPLRVPLHSDTAVFAPCDDTFESQSWFLNDVCNNNSLTAADVKSDCTIEDAGSMNRRVYHLSVEEAIFFSEEVESLISKLNPTIEVCSKLHPQMARKLTLTSAQCLMYSRCSTLVAKVISSSIGVEKQNILPADLAADFSAHWRTGLEGLAETVHVLLESHCWVVASIVLDCILGLPMCFSLDNVIASICSAIKTFSCSAPKVSWRLQCDKWLSSLLARGIHDDHGTDHSIIDLLLSMIGHPEPEQRFLALNHLGKLVGRDVDGDTEILAFTACSKLNQPELVASSCHSISAALVSSTWDQVVVVASSDMSLPLRIRAIALLISYVPFAERHQLQSLLTAVDTVLYGLTNLAQPTCEGPLIQLSLALVASVCLYSPVEDISLIPQVIWQNIETVGKLETEKRSGDLERMACQALLGLRNEEDGSKETLEKLFSSSFHKHMDPDFESTRGTILQVLSNLTSVKSYLEFFSKKTDQKVMEMEEAELEMDLILNEQGMSESFKELKDFPDLPFLSTNAKDDNRIQQIRNRIRSLEKLKLKEDIIARRQKKLLVRRTRQKYLEEAASREAELIQRLDSERTAEAEREIERQQLLELERAKTRELRHNLDMEREKQTQRELQRELEQAEAGIRSSRREFSSSNRQPRERFRERENGRPVNEGNLRTSTANMQPDSMMPTVVLSGSRQFSGQLPTILQSRDRQDEGGGSSYEENFDGSRDSGDTGSIGDPELVSALEGAGGSGSSQRHGPRGSKSRQIMERRDRDGRREGKWERKH